MGLTSQPTKTDASLGRVKSNDQPVTDLDTQVPAAEWERIKTFLIDVCDEVGNHSGEAGSLNARVESLETGAILADGSVAMAAALDMGGFAITNVGNVDGVDVSAHAARHILGGADPIDGDQLGIDFTPANYTPSVSPAEATSVDHLAAHLAGIDEFLGSTAGVSSVFGRSGDVVAADGDYAASQIVDDSAFGGGGAARVDAALDAMLLLDGTRAMAADLDLGGNALLLATDSAERIVANGDSIEAYTGGTLALTARHLLDASGDVGLLASATVDHTGIGTAYYDGARVDVDASGTVGDGTDDPDGIGSTLHRWRSDLGDGDGMVTRAAVTAEGLAVRPGNDTDPGIYFIGGVVAGKTGLTSSGAAGDDTIKVVIDGVVAWTFFDGILQGAKDGSASQPLYSRTGRPSGLFFSAAGGNEASLAADGMEVIRANHDPGTPADGDTNIAVRTHQDVGTGVAAALDDASLASMVIDGTRVMGVTDRGGTPLVDVTAAGALTTTGDIAAGGDLQGDNLVLLNEVIEMDQSGGQGGPAQITVLAGGFQFLNATGRPAIEAKDDPASPAEGDTVFALVTEQGTDGLATDDVVLGNDGSVPTGLRPLCVAVRGGGGS